MQLISFKIVKRKLKEYSKKKKKQSNLDYLKFSLELDISKNNNFLILSFLSSKEVSNLDIYKEKPFTNYYKYISTLKLINIKI